MKIKEVHVVTGVSANSYGVGMSLHGKKIQRIELGILRTNGDPFEHYIGYDEDGRMLFSVDKLCPCDVVYNTEG